ncbi:MAG: CPBP family glutamic-type intramembrane protease [Bacilli bacterium]
MKDIKDFHKSHKIWKRIGIIVAGVVILFLVTHVVGIILDFIFPNATVDENTTTLYSLNTVYTIFKALIFSVIAEELVFRKSISEVIDNKVAFVIISSIVYSATNIIYSDLSNLSVWINAIIYLCTYLTLSIIYVKNKDSVYPVMVMKFVLNLFPVIILLSGV